MKTLLSVLALLFGVSMLFSPVAHAAEVVPAPPLSFTAGMYVVGDDIAPGTYKTANPTREHCYFEVDKDLSGGSFGTISQNGNLQGPGVFTVKPSDKVVELTGPCVWAKSGKR
jgi:hypothetical protein